MEHIIPINEIPHNGIMFDCPWPAKQTGPCWNPRQGEVQVRRHLVCKSAQGEKKVSLTNSFNQTALKKFYAPACMALQLSTKKFSIQRVKKLMKNNNFKMEDN